MRVLRPFLWPAVLVAGCFLFAALLVKECRKLAALPPTPPSLTMAELASGRAPRWFSLTDGVPDCGRQRRVNNNDVIPVVAAADHDADRWTSVLLVSLESDEFCATLPSPLLLKPLRRSDYALSVLAEVGLPAGITALNGDLFEVDVDPRSDTKFGIGATGTLLGGCIAGLLWSVRKLRRRKGTGISSVGGSVPAPAGGVVEALSQGARHDATASLLPSAPLLLSARAQAAAWRVRYLGGPITLLMSAALVMLSVWGAVGVVNDLRAWYAGVPVTAELKGSSHSKLILSVVDVGLVYRMPDDDQLRTSRRMFMTFWMPDDDAGRARALLSDPDVVTFEEAVDLVPFRIPMLLLGLALAAVMISGWKQTLAKAGFTARIADTAREGVLKDPAVTEMRQNGAIVNHQLTGMLDGRAVSTLLSREDGPARFVLANAHGDLVVVTSGDGALFVPLFIDGEPFAWSRADLAKAQAVLHARGSPTKLEI